MLLFYIKINPNHLYLNKFEHLHLVHVMTTLYTMLFVTTISTFHL